MKEIKKILVPIDFSKNSQKIIKSAVYIAKKFQASLTAVFVVQGFDDYSGFFVPHMPIAQFEEEMLQSAERKMLSFLEENLEESEKLESVVLSGDVAEKIIDYAHDQNINMIVMGTHGYKGIEKLLFGSVATKVVKAADCPVMTINPYK